MKGTIMKENRKEVFAEEYVSRSDKFAERPYWIEGMERLISCAHEFTPRRPLNILDYGCNLGHLCRMMKMSFPGAEVDGFDINDTQLARARTMGPQIAYLNEESLSVGGSEYDLITVTYVLDSIPDLDTIIQRFHRLLKPGGLCLTITPNLLFDRLMIPYNLVNGYRSPPGLLHEFPRKRLRRLFEARGFHQIHQENVGERLKWLPFLNWQRARAYNLTVFRKL